MEIKAKIIKPFPSKLNYERTVVPTVLMQFIPGYCAFSSFVTLLSPFYSLSS